MNVASNQIDLWEHVDMSKTARAKAPKIPKERLHDYVCWSKMQAEAGQPLEQIVARKELERRAGNGLFSWGVGNSPSTLIPTLAKVGAEVDMLFSVMKSKPRAEDTAPSGIFVWRTFFDCNGVEQPLPPHLVITSRSQSASGPKRAHYALMCYSDRKLALGDLGPFDPDCYRNAGGTGGRVGSSQVTALLVQKNTPKADAPYRVAFDAKLIGSLWVKLGQPLLVPKSKVKRLKRLTEKASETSPAEWLGFAYQLREGPRPRKRVTVERTGDLFELT
ncbi:MAG: hypothetical protein BroJett013_22810 [Alphaproteobacteria bacterium]|nr:MAG: hypothetical protein BroJett013_22810 [Alphaproteobacteria bacterium]